MTTATVTAPLCRNFINGRWVESRSGADDRTAKSRESDRSDQRGAAFDARGSRARRSPPPRLRFRHGATRRHRRAAKSWRAQRR